MGKTYSKNFENKGDLQVSIVNSLESNSSAHEEHELKLWVIIALLVVLLGINLHKLYAQKVKRKALKSAMSIAQVDV